MLGSERTSLNEGRHLGRPADVERVYPLLINDDHRVGRHRGICTNVQRPVPYIDDRSTVLDIPDCLDDLSIRYPIANAPEMTSKGSNAALL
jgi:hypothetical protein